jgi:hypothetical protein
MKIIYLVETSSSGVGSKISNQISEWKTQGHGCNLRLLNKNRLLPCIFWAILNFRRDQYDLVYARESPFVYPFFALLSFLRPRTKLVIELNTCLDQEFLVKGQMLTLYVYKLLRSLSRFLALHYVGVTDEICRQKFVRQLPCTVIPNSFIPASISPARSNIDFDNDNRRLLGAFVVSKIYDYTGEEHLLSLLAAIPNLIIHFIGVTETEFKLIHHVPISLDNRLIFHGPLSQPQLLDLLKDFDFGISTLGLYRSGLTEACPLKSRLYMSCGLKIIAGYIDSAFYQGSPYILSITSSPRSVIDNIVKITDFISAPYSHAFALDHYKAFCSLNVIEKKRLSFFTTVCRS